MQKLKLGVAFGGMSTEHNVSVVSGTSVIKQLNKDKYEIYPIYISENGQWFESKQSMENVADIKSTKPSGDLIKIENPIKYIKQLDCIFPVLHGLYGEDGTIQGLFELAKVPYVKSSKICIYKRIQWKIHICR